MSTPQPWRFREPYWSIRDLLGWLIDRDPGLFGCMYSIGSSSPCMSAVNQPSCNARSRDSAELSSFGPRWRSRHILIAVAWYLAAHFPTERALLQTADIASRLMRGGEIHREAQAVG